MFDVQHHDGYNKVKLIGTNKIQLWVKSEATVQDKATVIKEWYRKQLKKLLPQLIENGKRLLVLSVMIGCEANENQMGCL